ncbi:MAG: formate dehydrogenase accessory protein FdhE [Gammaproteobacteria bacterium]|nr:formate dehydrogenase accessory protein FdhE [Gammaproteobacteria bacterium]
MTQILKPGEVTGPVPGIPHVLLPERATVFARRAARLRQLAEGHSLGEYLRFLASLAEAQQAALDVFPEVPLPTERDLALAHEHGLPPLSAASWPRSSAWRDALGPILDRTRDPAGLPEAARRAMARLGALPEGDLEAAATRVLAAEYDDADPALVPLVAAALQVYWVHLTTTLGAGAFARAEPPSLCPACGSRPLASVVLSGGETHGLRYLVCPLCASQWHLVRAKCVACDSARDLAYYALEPTGEVSATTEPRHAALRSGHALTDGVGAVASTGPASDAQEPGQPEEWATPRRETADARSERREAARHRPAVQAEACDGCRSYLKIVHVERDPALEPTADDLATVGLDLQMAEAGYTRFGASPLLVPGAG